MKILIVDDENIKLVSMRDYLARRGYEVDTAESGEEAMELLHMSMYDVVVADLKLPGMDGIELLKRVKEGPNARAEVVVITAYGSIPLAVEAMRAGAFDFLTKPFGNEQLAAVLERAAGKRKQRRKEEARGREFAREISAQVVGDSPRMRQVRDMIEICASSDANVLISGETGTGKDLVASIIHKNSRRHSYPFVKVSCALFPYQLFESELYGHEKGSFTGAVRTKKGRFELASHGTLYLDDVDDIPYELQVKLLRVIEEKEFERLGSTTTIRTDARIIASTKKDLTRCIAAGLFREDLYYRLNVLRINLPPLRERKEDIAALAEHFLKRKHAWRGALHEEVVEVLRQHDWPGNVRELFHTLENALALGRGELAPDIVCASIEWPSDSKPPCEENLKEKMERIERESLLQALRACGGNKTAAARSLGLKPSTFRDKLAKYGIDAPGADIRL